MRKQGNLEREEGADTGGEANSEIEHFRRDISFTHAHFVDNLEHSCSFICRIVKTVSKFVNELVLGRLSDPQME